MVFTRRVEKAEKTGHKTRYVVTSCFSGRLSVIKWEMAVLFAVFSRRIRVSTRKDTRLEVNLVTMYEGRQKRCISRTSVKMLNGCQQNTESDRGVVRQQNLWKESVLDSVVWQYKEFDRWIGFNHHWLAAFTCLSVWYNRVILNYRWSNINPGVKCVMSQRGIFSVPGWNNCGVTARPLDLYPWVAGSQSEVNDIEQVYPWVTGSQGEVTAMG